MRHIANDCLSALIDCDVLHSDGLIAPAPVSLERLDLRIFYGGWPGKFLENWFPAAKPEDVCDTYTFQNGPSHRCYRYEALVESVLNGVRQNCHLPYSVGSYGDGGGPWFEHSEPLGPRGSFGQPT
jgi:hypothetical protein